MRYFRQKPIAQVDYTDFNKYQPCWTCQNACGGCSWSNDFVPVENWIAVKNHIPDNGIYADTYKIMYCPEYNKDR